VKDHARRVIELEGGNALKYSSSDTGHRREVSIND